MANVLVVDNNVHVVQASKRLLASVGHDVRTAHDAGLEDVPVTGPRARRLAWPLLLASALGCAPSTIIGPLSHQQEERDHLLLRSREAGMSTDLLERVLPPLTPEEKTLADDQDHSCRGSYLRKNGFTWTGSGLVAAAAGLTIGGAYATSNNDTTGKLVFGVSAGTMAALGSGLVAIGGIIQERFSDRGCVTKLNVK